MAEKPTYEELQRRIQELEQAESELCLAEDRLKKIFDNTQDAIFINDLEGKVLDVNDKMCRMYGLTKEEALEVTIEAVSSPRMTLEDLQGKWKKALNGEKILFEWEARRPKDKSVFYVEVSIQKINFHDKDVVLANVRDITQRKKHEEEIEKSRRILLTVLNSIDAIVYIADMENYEVLFINDYCRRVSGDIVGHKCWKAIQGRQDEPCQFCTNDKLLTEEGKPAGVYQWEFQNLSNGRWYDCRDTAIEWPDGRVVRLEIATDITKRKQAEETLLHSQNLLRYIVEHTRSSVAVHDRNLNYIYVSQRYLDEFNVKEEDVIGKHHYEVFPDLPQKWRDIHQKALKGEVLSAEDDPYYREDGTVEWTRWECRPWYEQDGSIGGIIVYTEVITERKRIENALRESETRFRNLFEDIPNVAVQGYEMDGQILFWNKASEKLYGFSSDEALGNNLLELIIPDEMRAEVLEHMKEMSETGVPIPATEFNLKRKDGSRIPVYSSHSIVHGFDQQPLLFCIDVDLTELKQAEAERKKLQSQLFRSQKMESVGSLAGGVGHDFNNLLQTMRGNLELLTIKESLDSRSAERLKAVSRSIDRAAELVQQLLLFSRKAESKKERVDINREVNDVIQILKRIIPRMITLDLHLASSVWPLSGDPVQIEQVLLNLANNAVDAMPEGGRLTIETSNLEMDANMFKGNPDLAPGRYVQLVVSDTGCGMDEATQKQIFDPFFTTKEVGKGTGLGLASVYGIAKAHGGHIQCYSEPGSGTTFRVYLPAMEHAQVETAGEQTQTEPQGGNETILVVDDEPEIRELTRESLESFGYKVFSADNGEQVLELYREHGKSIDLILLDLNMPGMGGYKCLQELIAIDPAVKVVIASGYTVKGHGKDMLSSGAKTFIGKPYQLKELASIIRKTLDADKSLSQTLPFSR